MDDEFFILNDKIDVVGKMNISDIYKEAPQPLAFIRNLETNKRIAIKTAPIKMVMLGIPNISSYYPTDCNRQFIRIPLDENQPSCAHLKTILDEINKYLDTNEMKRHLFGRRYDKYEYLPSIRTPCLTDDSDDDCPRKPVKQKIFDYCKVKIISKKEFTERYGIANYTVIKRNGVDVETNTMTDIAKYIRFGSICEFKIVLSKVWANKSMMQGASHALYGLGLNMKEINIVDSFPKIPFQPLFNLADIKDAYKKHMVEKKRSPKKRIIQV